MPRAKISPNRRSLAASTSIQSNEASTEQSTAPLLVTVKETERLLSCCHVTVYNLIGRKEITAIKLGRRTLITMESIHALLAALPAAAIAEPKRAA